MITRVIIINRIIIHGIIRSQEIQISSRITTSQDIELSLSRTVRQDRITLRQDKIVNRDKIVLTTTNQAEVVIMMEVSDQVVQTAGPQVQVLALQDRQVVLDVNI